MKMEMSFYVEDYDRDAVKAQKRMMTLDFNSGSSFNKKAKTGALLASPDLNMLKLASPELERMIINQNGLITTPTPTQFICPKNVTEEQEDYARGFVEALNQLHKKDTSGDLPANTDDLPVVISQTTSDANINMNLVSTTPVVIAPSQPEYTMLTTCPSNVSSTAMPVATTIPQASMVATNSRQPTIIRAQNGSYIQLKEEPQTVPSLDSPPISPINMESQERIKLERKRERNRVAARKCRTRKLERISRLEDRVSGLKDQNTDLSDTANELRKQVCLLKQKIMSHVQGGCQVMATQNLL